MYSKYFTLLYLVTQYYIIIFITIRAYIHKILYFIHISLLRLLQVALLKTTGRLNTYLLISWSISIKKSYLHCYFCMEEIAVVSTLSHFSLESK